MKQGCIHLNFAIKEYEEKFMQMNIYLVNNSQIKKKSMNLILHNLMVNIYTYLNFR